MPAINKKTIRKGFFWLYVVGVSVLGIYLFFGQQIGAFFKYTLNAEGGNQKLYSAVSSIAIGYAFKPASFDPILYDPFTRNYLVDIYEGLVLTDKNLKIVPGIALTWGMKDALTWEFTLRPDIKFHDGTSVKAEDVLASISRARDDENSQLRNLLNTIDKIEIGSENKILIKTKVPDPLLLNKLAVTFIYPQNLSDFSKPVGTGPYKFGSMDSEKMVINRFPDYWANDRGFYNQVVLKYIADREKRLASLEKRDVQILTNVPPLAAVTKDSKYANSEGIQSITDPEISIKAIPSLEVSFIIFNLENPILKDLKVRQAINMALDRNVLVDLAFGFARPIGQYVSSGVFGFNPKIGLTEYNLENAKKTIAELVDLNTFEKTSLTFDYPESVEAIGQYVQQQFKELGIDLELNPLSDADLQAKIQSGTSEMYFLGWKSELGDAGDFFDTVVHSKDLAKNFGQFNGANYSNPEVDDLIEKSRQNLDLKKRLEDLQKAMKIVVEDDVIGVPLFESDTIFAYLKNIQFEPRIDGYMHADEIKIN